MTFLARQDFPQLLTAIQQAGYTCIGPQVRDGTIVYDKLNTVEQLPFNFQDRQSPGRYRLTAEQTGRYFAWANGAEALKPLTFAAREVIWQATKEDNGKLNFQEVLPEVENLAILGIKSCDLAALHLQDHHFAFNTYADHYYNHRRRQLLLIAVDCDYPAETCFCASTGDGPRASTGFDLALTELAEGFLLRAKSTRGQELIDQLPTRDATTFQHSQAMKQHENAVSQQTRQLPSHNLNTALFNQLEHPRWKAIGQRCLSCGNCTAVCPTCFCHNEVENLSLDGKKSEHYRQWDSCFTVSHSYMHSFILREETYLRYRQWLTHKLGSWHDQYGRSGCVGCGRCITWCPVGIDITEEVTVICGESGETV